MSGKQKLSLDQQQEVIRSYMAGEHQDTIAARVTTHPDAVLSVLRRAGIPIRKKKGGKPQTSPEKEQEIVAAYIAKERNLPKRFGVCKKTIYNILDRHNLRTRAPGGHNPRELYVPKKPIITERDQHIASLWAEGEGISMNAIAKQLGMSQPGVTHSLTKQGLRQPAHGGSDAMFREQAERKYIPKPQRFFIRATAFDVLDATAMYFLGFIIADGCIHQAEGRPSHRLHIRLAAKDREMLEKLRDWLESNHAIQEGEAANWEDGVMRPFVVYEPTSEYLCQRLMQLNVLPNKTPTASAPDVALNSADFWRGCVDGDGCVYRRGDGFPYLSGTAKIVDQFETYCQTLIPGLTLGKYFHVSHCGKLGCWRGCVRSRAEQEVVMRALYGNPAAMHLRRKREAAATYWRG